MFLFLFAIVLKFCQPLMSSGLPRGMMSCASAAEDHASLPSYLLARPNAGDDDFAVLEVVTCVVFPVEHVPQNPEGRRLPAHARLISHQTIVPRLKNIFVTVDGQLDHLVMEF